MTRIGSFALTLSMTVLVAGVGVACSDPADKLGNRRGTRSSGDGELDPNDPNNPDNIPEEQKKFLELQPEMEKKCGGTCHTDATYKPVPPAFLGPPDAYKSIKAHPGIVTRDIYQSALITKGPHAGPALNTDAEFEKKVVAWLEAESLAIQAQKLPTTEPFEVKQGANDIDLTPLCSGGLTGVHLKFQASVLSGMLSLTQLTLVAPAGSDVHLLQPKFYRVLAEPREDGTREIGDPADSFSNTDLTAPADAQTPVPPSSVFFSGDGWTPFDIAADKLRLEAIKLEPGKVAVLEEPKVCKDVAAFTNNVLPSLRGQAGGFNLNCANCHGNGLAGLALNDANQMLVCNQVLQKLTAPPNLANSLMIRKVIAPAGELGHSGGKITDTAGWQAVFTNNQGVFF